MNQFRIERPGESDWPCILEVLESANLQRLGGPEMREFPLSRCFIARYDGATVGVCGYQVIDATTARNTITVIASDYRGMGLGTRLKRFCIDFLAGQGIRKIFTNCDNQQIIRWNSREFGFRPTGRLIPKEEDFGSADATHWVNLVSEWPFRSATISDQGVNSYRQKGYCVLRDRFSPTEVGAWAAESERIWNQPGLVDPDSFRVQDRKRLDGGRVLERLDWVIPLSDLLSALSQDPRITAPVSRLLGSETVLFKDKLIVRPPGTHGYGLHQDFPYWEASGIPADELLTVCIALDETDEQNGMLGLFPGYHDRRLPAPQGGGLDVDPTVVEKSREEIFALQPGDLVAFHSLVPHRSGANCSLRNRRMLYFTYTDARHGAGVYDRFIELKAGMHAGASQKNEAR